MRYYMPSLTKLYQQAFQELFLPEGFKVHGKGFYRLCDDVVQIFYMRGYQGSYDFCFNIFPTSRRVKELYLEMYDIPCFRTQGCGWWPKQQLLLDAGFSEAVALTAKHVLPVFRQGTDSRSAYLALTDLERQIYSIGVIMNNFDFVLLCLQAGDYAQAEKHMAAIVAQNTPSPGQELSEARAMNFARIQEEFRHIHERNTEYWNPILDERRKVTMDFLASLEPKRRRKAPEV